MKKLLFFFVAVTIGIRNYAQTNVGGIISSNTTWTASGQPYIVVGNIQVDSGVTLNIEPGVIVKFNLGKSILIKGSLIAIGSNLNHIVFTSNASTPSKGDWGAIQFSSTSVFASYDSLGNYLNGSILKHATIEYGGSGSDGSLVINSPPFIDSCTIRFSKTDGIYGKYITHDVRITNSSIYDNDGDIVCSICASGITIMYSQINAYLIGNKIYNNHKGGIYITNSNSYILKNYIADNTDGNGGGAISADGVIEENIICNNYGYYSGGIFAQGSIIKNNFIIGNKSDSRATTILGLNDTIINNIFAENLGKEAIIEGSGRTFFSNNQIIHNNAPVIFNHFSNLLGASYSFNTLAKNATGDADFVIKNGNYVTTLFNNNLIDDSLTFTIKNSNNSNTVNHNASNNYWNTTQTSAIDNKIFDFYDSFNQGIVNYVPILTSLDTLAPISPPNNVFKTDLVGGNIKLTWSQNLESDLAGYKIHWNPISCCSFANTMDVGKVNSFILNGLTINDTIAITAYDNTKDGIKDQLDGNESWFSYFDINQCSTSFGFLNKTVCNSYISPSGNHIWTSSNVYMDTIYNVGGCDSIITINLTVNPSEVISQTLSLCSGQSIIVGSNTYSANGTYTDTLNSPITGCDSIVNTILTIVPIINTYQTASLCSGYSITVGANTYNSTGSHTDVLTSFNGCDSTVYTNLTVSSTIHTSQAIFLCAGESIIVGSHFYSSPGVYADTLTATVGGCDSVVTTNLTVNPPISGIDTQLACGSYTWIDGILYTSSNNTATMVFTSSEGCDSTLTLHLTINNSQTVNVSESICQGDSVMLAGAYQTTANTYTDYYTGANGCDSVVVTQLNINSLPDIITTIVSDTIFSNQNAAIYQWIDCNNNLIIAGETNQNYTATVTGNYAVVVTYNGCSDTSSCVYMLILGTENLPEQTNNLQVFPNPSTGQFYFSGLEKESQIEIYDITGRIVFETIVKNNTSMVDLTEKDKGVYFYKIISSNKLIYQGKLILQ